MNTVGIKRYVIILISCYTQTEEDLHSLKAGKPPGMDNIYSALLKNGGAATALTVIKKVQEMKELLKKWTQLLVIPLPKKGNFMQCQHCCTIGLIIHPSKLMLQVILIRLKVKAEELLAEE